MVRTPDDRRSRSFAFGYLSVVKLRRRVPNLVAQTFAGGDFVVWHTCVVEEVTLLLMWARLYKAAERVGFRR